MKKEKGWAGTAFLSMDGDGIVHRAVEFGELWEHDGFFDGSEGLDM